MESIPNPEALEPSSEHAAIPADKVMQRLPILQAKLAEYHDQVDKMNNADFLHMPPDELAALYPEVLSAWLKPVVLESILETAQAKNLGEDVDMSDIALGVRERIGIDMSYAATVPFVLQPGGFYSPDRQLRQEASPEIRVFLDVYAIMCGYAIGAMRGISGGTGLPEVNPK